MWCEDTYGVDKTLLWAPFESSPAGMIIVLLRGVDLRNKPFSNWLQEQEEVHNLGK